jgi:hypothetical protein
MLDHLVAVEALVLGPASQRPRAGARALDRVGVARILAS